jgi:mRNA interferase MazF
MAAWVPDVGDIVWLQFDPQAGHEQAGHRPALVLTPSRYNEKRGMMICCPMTSRIKGYAFEVVVSRNPPSVVLADQVKSIDWRARQAVQKGRVSAEILADVQAKIRSLLGF